MHILSFAEWLIWIGMGLWTNWAHCGDVTVNLNSSVLTLRWHILTLCCLHYQKRKLCMLGRRLLLIHLTQTSLIGGELDLRWENTFQIQNFAYILSWWPCLFMYEIQLGLFLCINNIFLPCRYLKWQMWQYSSHQEFWYYYAGRRKIVSREI